MLRLVLPLLVLLSPACQDSPATAERVVLVVGTGHDLDWFPSWQGSTAYAMDLVYLPALDYMDIEYQEDGSAALRPRPGGEYDVTYLCERLIGLRLAGAPTVRDGACVVPLPANADRAQTEATLVVEVGPYRLGGQGPDGDQRLHQACEREVADQRAPGSHPERIVLCARDPDDALDEIHIVSMPVDEQWRSLVAGRIDVIPHTPGRYSSWLEGMRSVRMVPLQTRRPWALYFNTHKPRWTRPASRRALARALDLRAVSRVACRDARCRNLGRLLMDSQSADRESATQVTMPQAVTVLVNRDVTICEQAAKVMAVQLEAALNMQVHIESVPVSEFSQQLERDQHDFVIMPVPGLETPDPQQLLARLRAFSDYHNPALADLLTAGQFDEAKQLLQSDMPVLPLFQEVPFAAIDERFCGGRPREVHSWAWLADVIPCGDGATP